MYAHNQFSQSTHYASRYPVNFLPYGNDYYYAAYNPWSQNAINDRTFENDPVVALLKKRDENQRSIEKYIEDIEGSPEHPVKEKCDERRTLRISEAREILMNSFKTIEKLETLGQELKNNDALTDSEWQTKYRECAAMQAKVAEMLEKFGNDESTIEGLKRLVEQRRKKRLREVRKRLARKAEKSRADERRARRHAEAGAWIREKQEIIEREKQVVHLRKDADIVLADVRGKRNDARKFLGLLQELQKLRKVKVNIARARGENLPPAADQAFDNIIGQLLDQWACLDREYSIEEQGLKLMLKTDNEEKIEKQKRSTFDEWENVLFGRKLQSYDSSRGDLHGLVMIRHAWDKYANNRGKGSRIPIGWVMPVAPSSAAWQRCLKRE